MGKGLEGWEKSDEMEMVMYGGGRGGSILRVRENYGEGGEVVYGVVGKGGEEEKGRLVVKMIGYVLSGY